MEIRMYQAGDELKIVDLFQKVFKRPMSISQWEWRFARNPNGNYKIALMWDKNVLAGHYAVSPVKMYFNGKTLKAASSLTTMTHPAYGGRGIFKTLSTYLYDILEREHNYELIWGFPNVNSHYGFIKYLGWRDIATLHTLAASSSEFKDVRKLPITKVDLFTSEMAYLLNSRAKESAVYVDRSKRYLNWRIVEKPSIDYDIWLLGSELIPEAILVTNWYHVKNNVFDLNIVDWVCKEGALLPMLIGSIIEDSKINFKEIRRVALWNNLFKSSVYGILEKIGFKPELPITYLAGRTTLKSSPALMSMKNWHISFIDSDVY